MHRNTEQQVEEVPPSICQHQCSCRQTRYKSPSFWQAGSDTMLRQVRCAWRDSLVRVSHCCEVASRTAKTYGDRRSVNGKTCITTPCILMDSFIRPTCVSVDDLLRYWCIVTQTTVLTCRHRLPIETYLRLPSPFSVFIALFQRTADSRLAGEQVFEVTQQSGQSH